MTGGSDCTAADCRDCLIGDAPVLVLAPHPDDETLGCGGLLAQAFAGPGAHVVCMSDGAASHPGSRDWPPARLSRLRADELALAVARLGGTPADLTCLGLPDSRMEDLTGTEALADRIGAIARRIGARRLFATAVTDPHCDHRATAAIARSAAARHGLILYDYPVWSRWKLPDYRDRLGPVLRHRLPAAAGGRRKAHALAAHRSQRGKVVRDTPEGFAMPGDFMRLFLEQDEYFYETRP